MHRLCALDKTLPLSGPQFAHLLNRGGDLNNCQGSLQLSLVSFNILIPEHSRINGDCPRPILSPQEVVLALLETWTLPLGHQAPGIQMAASNMAACGPG